MSKASFLLLYLVFMVPTYVLPYFGSNSVFAQTASSFLFGAPLGLAWLVLHIGAFVACGHVAAERGRVTGSKTSMELAVAAAMLFDLLPLLSMIPLVPTVIHAIVLGKGLSGPDEYPEGAEPQGLAAHPYLVLLGIVVLTFAAAGYVTYNAAQKVVSQKPAVSVQALGMSSKGTSPSQQKEASNPATARDGEESRDARNGSGDPQNASPFGNPYEKLASNPPLRQAPSEAASGGYAAQQTFAKTESELTAEKRAEAEAKKAEQLAKVQKLNEYLETPEAANLAMQYMQSYVGYLALEDTFSAVALFGADRAYTDELIAWIRKYRGVASVRYGHVQLLKSSDPLKPNRFRMTANMTSVGTNLGAPGTETVYIQMTLSEDGSKFVYVKPW